MLLSKSGVRLLAKLALAAFATSLATTTYAIIASTQLFLLFALWTPSGIIWWQAEGFVLIVVSFLYLVSWLLLIWASYDAGAEVQSGALEWLSLAQNINPETGKPFKSGDARADGMIFRSYQLTCKLPSDPYYF